MDDRWVGTMPVEDLLKDFLPPANDPLPCIQRDPFRKVCSGTERDHYGPFVSTQWCLSISASITFTIRSM